MGTTKALSEFTVADVCSMLEDMQMDSVIPAFKENAVNGEDLLGLSDDEMKTDLQLTNLQMKKLRRHIAAMTGERQSTTAAATASSAEQGKQSAKAGGGIREEDVKRYSHLVHEIATLEAENVELKLPEARAKLQGLQQHMAAEQQKLGELEQKLEKQAKEVHKVEEKWYPGKIIGGKKKAEERKERERESHSRVLEERNQEVQMLDDLACQVARKQREVEAMRSKVNQLDVLRQQNEDLVSSVFKGEGGVADEKEEEMERACNAMEPRLLMVKQYHNTYAKTLQLLRTAHNQLLAARQDLQRAFGMSTMDVAENVFTPPARQSAPGLAADLVKRRAVKKAAALCASAQSQIDQARALIPDLPHIKEGEVKKLGGVMGDLVFDNIVSDLIVRRKIKASMQTMEAMERDTDQAVRWVDDWLNRRIKPDLAGLQSSHAQAVQELNNYRKSLLDAAMQSLALTQSADA